MKRVLLPVILLAILFVILVGGYRHLRARPLKAGWLKNKQMDEIAGMAASGIYNSVYYVHNDSGDTSRFFAITPDGEIKSVIYYQGDPKVGLSARDCEDIAVGPGPERGKSYVYMGDIGDKHALRAYITVYRMEEKKSWIGRDSIIRADAVPVHFKYPNGPCDARSLMVDPIEKLIYIISKRAGSVTVYTSPLDFKGDDTLTLRRRGQVHFTGLPAYNLITAGDISKDGQQVLLKSYIKVYYWKRKQNEPVWETVLRKPEELPYHQEKQGESVAFTPDGKGFYTTGKGLFSPIYHYSIPGN